MRPNLIVTSDNYPTPSAPNFGTFLSALVTEWAKAGAQVDVVAPMARFSRQPSRLLWRQPAPLPTPTNIRVSHPLFTSISNGRLGPFSRRELGIRSFVRSAARAAITMSPDPDLTYGHFLYRGGAAALRIAEHFAIPAVVALGEATFDDYEQDLGLARMRRDLNRFRGIVAVSDLIRDRCIERFAIPPERIRVFPNGIDFTLFKPMDRRETRAALGLPADRPIIAFVGHFIERKGPMRVMEALRRHPELGGVFIGDGPQKPTGEQVLIAAPAVHEDIPRWIAACDVFVLPTLAEGSCNALIEAMACGRAIVTSEIPSIRELTGREAVSLVDPMNVDAISQAVDHLIHDDDARTTLERRALERSGRYSLDARAQEILDWLEELSSSGEE